MAQKRSIKKSKQKKIKKDPFIYMVLLSMFSILLVALNKIYGSFGLGIVVLPVIIFINNYMVKEFKKEDIKLTLVISILSIIMYSFLLYNLMNRIIPILVVLNEVLIYSICFIVNNMVYKRIIDKKKEKKYLVLNYILVISIYLILYIVF